jgi:hypothetical protein
MIACSLLGPASAQADVNVADVLGPTKVSAYGGRVVWSAFNPADQENRLMTRLGDGPVEAVPIPPTPTPFEADLGPGPDGHIVAVYPRCEPGCVDFSRFGDGPARARYVRDRLGSGRLEDAVAPKILTGLAVDGGRFYYGLQESEPPLCDTDPPSGSTLCHVRLADAAPAFRPYVMTRSGPGYGPPPKR